MKDILEQIKLLLNINQKIELFAVVSEDSESEFNVFEKRGQLVACYEVNGYGGLKHFQSCRNLELVRDAQLSHEKMQEIAYSFLNVFAPSIVKSIYFSNAIDFGEVYQLVYERKDERYGLSLPHTSVVMEIAKDGCVHYFLSQGADSEVWYPEKLISKEEAKEKYAESLEFELLFAHVDKERFVNGDDMYHLVYAPKNYGMDVGAGGELHTWKSYNGFVPQFDHIEKRMVPKEEILKLIGLDDTYVKIHTGSKEAEITELWTKQGYEEDIEIEEGTPFHTIQVCFNQDTFQCISVMNNEQNERNKEAITEEEARELALQFLFACYPDADEQFMIERSHPSHHCMWEDEGCESQYGFWFHPMYGDKRVETYSMVIQVGQRSRKIVEFKAHGAFANELNELTAEPSISETNAKEVFVRDLDMELLWLKAQGEERMHYELCYAASFPKTDRYVRMIEAHTGKAFHVKG